MELDLKFNMKTKHGKILENGESTYRNGAGGFCGGVISQSLFLSEPMAYMMAWVMPDKYFEKYKALKEVNKDKEAEKVFENLCT